MKNKIKVAKKDERLARALSIHNLLSTGFPLEKISERVDKSWCSNLRLAREINKTIGSIEEWELFGCATQADIERWRIEEGES